MIQWAFFLHICISNTENFLRIICKLWTNVELQNTKRRALKKSHTWNGPLRGEQKIISHKAAPLHLLVFLFDAHKTFLCSNRMRSIKVTHRLDGKMEHTRKKSFINVRQYQIQEKSHDSPSCGCTVYWDNTFHTLWNKRRRNIRFVVILTLLWKC